MLTKFELDHDGIAELLKGGQIRALVDEAAQSVASNVTDVEVSDGEAPVVVDSYTTDRAAASVTLAHAAGLALQAKHGTLTRAAGAAGLEVTERSS
jgi:hypothetical protein